MSSFWKKRKLYIAWRSCGTSALYTICAKRRGVYLLVQPPSPSHTIQLRATRLKTGRAERVMNHCLRRWSLSLSRFWWSRDRFRFPATLRTVRSEQSHSYTPFPLQHRKNGAHSGALLTWRPLLGAPFLPVITFDYDGPIVAAAFHARQQLNPSS